MGDAACVDDATALAPFAGAFAVFHGAAHGLEGAEDGAVPLSYFVGFLVATLLLHCAGIGLGAAFNAVDKKELLQRAAGVALGIAGLVMIIGLGP